MSANRRGLVEILCDGDSRHGLGHLSRSAALASELIGRGHRVRLEAVSLEGQRLLGPRAMTAEGTTAITVLDLPYDRDDLVAARRQSGIKTLALDYFGTAAPDLTISVLERGKNLPGRRLSGFEYAIIRSEVLALGSAPKGDGVIVVLGGGDVRRRGPEVAARIASMGERVTLIEGPAAQESAASPGVLVLRSPADFPARMAGCAWAVTNGGVTMTELMYLGKAVHVVPQTPEEDAFARRLAATGALLGSGECELAAPEPERLRSVAAAAREAFDGRGARRIADELEGLL